MSTSFASLSRSSALIGALALATIVGVSAPAAAHNFVVSSTPEQDQVITALPDVWQLTTNEQLLDLGGEGAGFAMLIADESGLYYGDGCVTVDGATMSTPAALGEPGLYSMVYQFISADGHTLSDELTFTWEPAEAVEPHVGLAEPPVCGETASAPAPAPEPSPTTEPETEATDEAESAPDTAPTDADETPVPFFGIALGAVVLGGIILAIVLAMRARTERTRQSNGDAPIVAGDGGSTSRSHTDTDSSSDGGSSGDGGGGGD
jgi:methionine-rich copper-binding protein CopC